MNIDKIIEGISQERFAPYLRYCNHNKQKALKLYQKNIEVSQAFYTSLSVLEITLRNRIDQSCKNHFATENWLTEKLPPELLKQVIELKIKLTKAEKEPSNSKILAELNFGFWTTLFNRRYAKLFWKPLHRIFPNMPKKIKKRTEVSSRLNHIRTFRNRVYHYEPIIWNMNVLSQKRKEVYELTMWLDRDTAEWVSGFDNLKQTKSLE